MDNTAIESLKSPENSDEQRTRGRRPNGLDMVTRNVNLERDMVEWAQDQPGGLSPTLRSLMRQANARQVRPLSDTDDFKTKRQRAGTKLRREFGEKLAAEDREFAQYIADIQGEVAKLSEDDREVIWFQIRALVEKRIMDTMKKTVLPEHYRPHMYSREKE